jgi:hypothetical protein
MFARAHRRKLLNRSWGLMVMVLFVSTLVIFSHGGCTAKKARITFTSAEEAVEAMMDAVSQEDTQELLAIFGPEAKELISSGDEFADKAARERFVQAYKEMNKLVKETDEKATLLVGREEWPFPIPIVKVGESWRFDTAEGKDELLNRRIGRNELNTIQVCLAYVDAQREYALKDRDGDGLMKYAQKFESTKGKKDGLYWKTEEGEDQSPLGSLAAKATQEGYTSRKSGEEPQPYWGYYYKILKAQGENAPGGAYDYVVNGKMIGGFALVAFPAEYGNAGIMTFMVNHDGVVYQQNLGEDTEKISNKMKQFDPDETWEVVQE